MKIPERYNDYFNKYMYDKTIKYYLAVEEVDEELSVITVPDTTNIPAELKCNYKPVTSELLSEEYGYNIDADYMITLPRSTKENLLEPLDLKKGVYDAISKGNYIELEDKMYKVVKTLNFDTHRKVFISAEK